MLAMAASAAPPLPASTTRGLSPCVVPAPETANSFRSNRPTATVSPRQRQLALGRQSTFGMKPRTYSQRGISVKHVLEVLHHWWRSWASVEAMPVTGRGGRWWIMIPIAQPRHWPSCLVEAVETNVGASRCRTEDTSWRSCYMIIKEFINVEVRGAKLTLHKVSIALIFWFLYLLSFPIRRNPCRKGKFMYFPVFVYANKTCLITQRPTVEGQVSNNFILLWFRNLTRFSFRLALRQNYELLQCSKTFVSQNMKKQFCIL